MSDKPEPGLGVLRKANCLCYTMREPVQLCAHRSSTRITKHLQQVIINELLADNKAGLQDEQGDTPAWVELFNPGTSPVSLQGYKLTDEADGSTAWTFPAVTIAAGQYIVIFLDGKDITDPSKPLHTSFKLSKDHDYLALLSPSGVVVSVFRYPMLPADVSFGTVGTAGVVSAQQERPPGVYAVLLSPTPGQPNSGPRPDGPLVIRTTRSPSPRPDGSGDIAVTATVQQQQNPVDSVNLVYLVGYGPETNVSMTGNPDGTYSASIPQAVATPGALVRWFIQASDSVGTVTRDPPYHKETDRQYYGTIVADKTDSSNLFVLELYCPLDNAPVNQTATPGCSLLINNTLYDNFSINRRGVTSLQWPKPKVKIASKQGAILKVLKGWHKVSEISLNGEWAEPGENTFMREPLVWQTFREAGMEAIKSFHSHVRFNGKFYGKFAIGEIPDTETLKGWGYNTNKNGGLGPLWKSTSGEYSNLRWDIAPEHIQYFWKKETRKNDSDDQALLDFARGISGGGPVVRSSYLFDAVNLPQVVNHMAAQTLILNQDRCTKNFYVYLDMSSQQWSMFAWDLAVKTPWGLISAVYPTWSTGRRRLQGASDSSSDLLQRAARKLMQDPASPGLSPPTVTLLVGDNSTSGAPANGAAAAGLSLPANSTIGADYDVDQTKKGNTTTGAPGTYNYLIDAILAVPRTRQMYMRRLRTLMDQFIASGRLEAIVNEMYNTIRNEAKRDAAKWNNPGDVDRGHQQLIQEQLPIRKQQLYETYGPKGAIPLIPDAQPAGPQLSMGKLEPGSSGYVQVVNANTFAVDISGYSLGGAVQFTFRPGTVIPAQDSVYVAADINAFKQRSSSPKGGEGKFVVGPFAGQLLGAGASVTLADPQGQTVATT
ncbi:hypothetical protein N2152v2_010954 [Parachlorella kessleri]